MAYQKSDRQHLRYVFISRRSARSEFIDIAFITDSMTYYEYEMQFIQHALTYYVCNRIMSLFADYIIDQNTDICYNSDVFDKAHPFLIYLRIIHQHVPFNFKGTDFKNIVYISTERKSKILPPDRDKNKITFKHANRLWRVLIKTKQCRWITQNFDDSLKMLKGIYARSKVILRLGAYYMTIKAKRQ